MKRHIHMGLSGRKLTLVIPRQSHRWPKDRQRVLLGSGRAAVSQAVTLSGPEPAGRTRARGLDVSWRTGRLEMKK